jgi:glycosyltransferase involved in cell wall biosynthesis
VRRLAADIAGADIVHVTAVYSFPVIPALLAARVARKPVVWSPRGSLTGWKQRSRGRLKRCWELMCEVSRPRTVVLHVTSEHEARDARACFPRVQSVVIANGVETSELTTHPAPGRRLRMLYVGRLHRVKGLENLVEACARLRSELDFQLTIVGGGEPEFIRRLSRRALQAGVADRVRMTGELVGPPKESAFADSDLVVLPSHSENFGMAIAEALARGIPVIASRQTPWARVEEVGCGLWVDNDPDSLAEAIVRAASMPLREMGAKGRAWMRAEFGWPARAARMLQLYRSMLSGAPNRAAAVGTGGHRTA